MNTETAQKAHELRERLGQAKRLQEVFGSNEYELNYAALSNIENLLYPSFPDAYKEIKARAFAEALRFVTSERVRLESEIEKL